MLGAVDRAAAVAGLEPEVVGAAATGVLRAAGGLPAGQRSQFVTALRASPALGRSALGGTARTGRAVRAGSVVVLQAAPPVRNGVDMWGPVPAADLMRGSKTSSTPVTGWHRAASPEGSDGHDEAGAAGPDRPVR